MKIAIRLILTAALLVGVYSETGVWTTFTLALVSGGLEVEAALWRRTLKPTTEEDA